MAHPRQLIEALMKRLLDAKKVNTRQQRTARNPAPEGGYENVEGGIARENLNEVLEADFTADKLRQARQEVRGAQGRDPLEQPVESGLSRYLPEENIHEPMMPRTRDGSPRTRDRTRLPDSESNWDRRLRIADEEKTKRMRKGTHRDTKADNLRVMEDDFISAQKEFERLAGRPPSGEEMKDIGTLEKLVDLLKDASGSGKKVSRPTLADDIDDIPF